MNSIETDLHFLCEELEDRQAQTDGEKRAAEYVTDRFGAAVGNSRRVDFDAIGNYRLMFAAYCGEFIVVSLLALWWPTIAFFYGLTIFLAYMAEFMGYAVFSRLLPQFESSSAVGLTEAHDASCGDCVYGLPGYGRQSLFSYRSVFRPILSTLWNYPVYDFRVGYLRY